MTITYLWTKLVTSSVDVTVHQTFFDRQCWSLLILVQHELATVMENSPSFGQRGDDAMINEI